MVSRKVGNAVVRNRVRRRLREALRELVRAGSVRAEARASHLIVIARPEAATTDYHALKRSLTRALGRSSFL